MKSLERKDANLIEQTPIPCFRCGVCCTCYQAPLTTEDIDNIASALGISGTKCLSRYAVKLAIKEGHLLKRTGKGCVFLAWDVDGKARCRIYTARPKACRTWTPSLSRPECLEGFAKLKSERRLMLLRELFPSCEQQKQLYQLLGKAPPQP